MKKLILTLSIVLASVSATAQHYRGFLDLMMTYPVSNSHDVNFDVASGFSLGGTTSHGVQFKNLFVGAGTGAMFIPSSYSVGLPVFAEARWDFFRGRITNFFVGCKIGGIFNIGDKYGIDLDQGDNSAIYGYAGYGNIYFQPSVGIRFRLNNTMGINVTLSYLPMKFNREKCFGEYLYYDTWGNPIHEYRGGKCI